MQQCNSGGDGNIIEYIEIKECFHMSDVTAIAL